MFCWRLCNGCKLCKCYLMCCKCCIYPLLNLTLTWPSNQEGARWGVYGWMWRRQESGGKGRRAGASTNFLFCIGNLVSHNPLERQYLKQHATVEVYRLYAKTHERLCGRIWRIILHWKVIFCIKLRTLFWPQNSYIVWSLYVLLFPGKSTGVIA